MADHPTIALTPRGATYAALARSVETTKPVLRGRAEVYTRTLTDPQLAKIEANFGSVEAFERAIWSMR